MVKKGKYIHQSFQNEYLKIMALSILREISDSIMKGVYYSTMEDEVSDKSNQERAVHQMGGQ